MISHLDLFLRRTMYTVTPLITTTASKTSASAPPELSLLTGLGLMLGIELGLLCVGEGVGDEEVGSLPTFFLTPGRGGDGDDWVAVAVGDGGGVVGLDE